MRVSVISTQNGLLSGALVKYLQERGETVPQRVLTPGPGEPLATCRAVGADILLMEVTRLSPYTFAERQETVTQVRSILPACKIALLCDENADRALAEQVKAAKKSGLIDGFFYTSVSGEYLADALDTL